MKPLESEDSTEENFPALLRWAIFAIPVAVLAPFFDLVNQEAAGRILGLLVAYVFLLRVGFPSDRGSGWKRSARVLLAVLAYVVIDRIINPLVETTGFGDDPVGTLIAVCLITAISFWGTVLIAQRLKLYDAINLS